MTKTIVSDEILVTETVKQDLKYELKLCKQSYSDGTCFYTLQDKNGNWKVDYGNKKLESLIDQLSREIMIDNDFINNSNLQEYPDIIMIHEEFRDIKIRMVNHMKGVLETHT